MSGDVCSDDRFELIAEARDTLLERTNIEDSPDEMAVLDSILFRCWQMGWLDQLNVVRCRDCKHGHMTIDGNNCKWCDLITTHDMDGNEPNNGYDPEPYFDAEFFCAWGERKVVE